MILTYKFRLKDRHAAELGRQARAVSFIWNYCNEMQQKAARAQRKWLSDVDLQQLTSGSSALLDVHSATVSRVCRQYVSSRRQHRRAWLRFRGKRSLGWVPYRGGSVKFDGQAFVFRGQKYFPMHMRDGCPSTVDREGSFSQDAEGHWYINVRVSVEPATHGARPVVGIDLGLKDVAVLSTGERLANLKPYRALEKQLAVAQRANKKRRAVAVSAKIANVRADHLHKASAHIAKTYGLIFVGDVSPTQLARTRFAKSILDASWGTFRRQLQYKAIAHGGRCFEVKEHLTTQLCSSCGSLPLGRPEGIAGLRIREWTCGDCGAAHDRDVNAALNIAARGLASLVEGASMVSRSSQLSAQGLLSPSIEDRHER